MINPQTSDMASPAECGIECLSQYSVKSDNYFGKKAKGVSSQFLFVSLPRHVKGSYVCFFAAQR